jgi:transcription initiation factor TFIID TATA-box-binding protein
MRKRKYTENNDFSDLNVLTEDIDLYLENITDNDIPPAEVHNLVGTCRIWSSVLPLDLQHVSMLLPNTHYDKQKFAAITLRLHSPVCTVLLFTSGKLVLTGSKTFTECVFACHRILQILRMGTPGVSFMLMESNIQNIVGNVNLRLPENSRINLDALHEEHGVFCTYQKNMFPGLIFRPLNSPVVLLIFTSGKIVLTGAKSCRLMRQGWKDLWPLVSKYIIKDSDATAAESLTAPPTDEVMDADMRFIEEITTES